MTHFALMKSNLQYWQVFWQSFQIGYAKNDLKDKQKLEEIRTKLAEINLKEVKETLNVGDIVDTPSGEQMRCVGFDNGEPM